MFSKNYLLIIEGENVEKPLEASLDLDFVKKTICDKPYLLSFLINKREIHCYPKILQTETYKYVQLLGVPVSRRVHIYPIIYDYYTYKFTSIEEFEKIPYMFTGLSELHRYIYWLNRCRANWALNFKLWIDSIRVSKRRLIDIPLTIFILNGINPEILDRVKHVNKTSKYMIGVLVIRLYKKGDKHLILSVDYYGARPS